MSLSLNRVTTRSQSRALAEFKTRRIFGSLPRRGLPYVSLNRLDPATNKSRVAVKRKCPASSVNGGDPKRRKTKKNEKKFLIPYVSADGCDSCCKPEEESRHEINELPIEILTQIFRILPCRDRNSVKLVCRHWYNACNTVSITSSQKLVCPKTKKLQSFMKTLEQSRLKWLNVEFRFSGFDACRRTFWSRVGPRIRSLQFVDCELNSTVISLMGRNCSRLQHLSWEYRNPCDKNTMYPLDACYLYSKLISKTPFLSVLTSLHIHIWNVPNVVKISEDRFLMAVLSKYPNLRSLHVKLLPGRSGSVMLPFHETLFKQLLNSRLETLTFLRGRLYLESDIPNIDNLPTNYTLRQLTFSVWKCDSKLQSYFVQKFQGLKHLEFCDIFGNEVLQDIWRYQTGLSSIILNWLQCSDHGFSGMVNDQSDELDEWDRFARTSTEPGYCVSRLSKLERMKIILVEKPEKLTENVLSYFIFPNLRSLDISLWTTNMQFTLKLLKHLGSFTNLEELRVYYDKPVPYYPWIKALRNLKKLRVVFIEENYTNGFGDRQYKRFFSSLPQLRRLEHRHIRTQVRWTRDSMHEEPKKIVFSQFPL